MTDNFMVAFDDAGTAVLAVVSTNQKPNGTVSKTFLAYVAGYLHIADVAAADVNITKIYLGLVPFAKIAYTFKEAELATLGGGATAENDATASGGQVAYLNAQNEYSYILLNDVLNYLPVGRYRLIVRAKDSNQVANDLGIRCLNETDVKYLQQDNSETTVTCTAAFTFFTTVFDLTNNDSGDTITLRVQKKTANANAISVDYFLIVPLGNGCDFPQDIAHNALRSLTKTKNIYKR
jgi:hypothetical protein